MTIEAFKNKIVTVFEVKDVGKLNYILSMKAERHEDGSLTLDQTAYADEVLKTLETDSAKGASIPLDPGIKFIQATDNKVMSAEEAY